MENTFNFLKTAFYAVFVYLGIKTGVVMVLFILMGVDSFLGILKALRLGNKFSFKILAWGVVTKLSILVIPMVLALMGKALSFEFTYFVIAVMNIIIVSEGISCITNILSIKSKKAIENTDYVTMLLHLIKRALSGIVERLFAVIEQNKVDTPKK